MFMPGIETETEADGPLVDVTAGTVFGVVTETPPGVTATEAPVPGAEAETEGMAEETIGTDGMGSSTLADGIEPDMSAEALRPAADAVTVALVGAALKLAEPPTKA
jgi:expansin (peptidoglycan-binding protein)